MNDEQQMVKKCIYCEKEYVIGGRGGCAACLDRSLTYLEECHELARAIREENTGLLTESSETIRECLGILKEMIAKEKE